MTSDGAPAHPHTTGVAVDKAKKIVSICQLYLLFIAIVWDVDTVPVLVGVIATIARLGGLRWRCHGLCHSI